MTFEKRRAPKTPRLFILALITGLVGIASAQAADDTTEWHRWFTHDENSMRSVDHSVWTRLLIGTVHVVDPTKEGGVSQRRAAQTGSRLKGKRGGGSSVQANRVAYGLLRDRHKDAVHAYLRRLQKVEVSGLSRDEQLAYWLNFYNAGVYALIADAYPIHRIKTLRLGSRRKPAAWAKKKFKVEGVSLSLNDIRERILLKVWPDPLVLYGLFDGTLGAPDILNRAFTADNVSDLLEFNAHRFVNSRRAIRFAGRPEIKVSQIYQWGAVLFPNGDTDIIAHLTKFANPYLEAKLAKAKRITSYFFNWRTNEFKKYDAIFQDKLANIGFINMTGASNN